MLGEFRKCQTIGDPWSATRWTTAPALPPSHSTSSGTLVSTTVSISAEICSHLSSEAATLRIPDGDINREKEELVKKSQDLVVGWAHTKEYQKKYCSLF